MTQEWKFCGSVDSSSTRFGIGDGELSVDLTYKILAFPLLVLYWTDGSNTFFPVPLRTTNCFCSRDRGPSDLKFGD